MAELVIMPRLSLNEETCLLSNWYVNEGDRVAEGDKLFGIETDKSTLDVEAEYSGVVIKKYYDDFEVVEVLTPVCAIGTEGEKAPELEAHETRQEAEGSGVEELGAGTLSPGEQLTEEPAQGTSGKRFFSPRAKGLAGRNGLSLDANFSASGAEGRVMEADVIRFMEQGGEKDAPHNQGEKRVVRLSKIRNVIAANMMNSLQSTAQLTINSVFNASVILALREKYKGEQGDWKDVTIGDLILYATAKTLAQTPYMNALYENEGEVTEFSVVNLGCAVDTERGLMVPTLFRAEQKDLLGLSQSVKVLAKECQDGSILPDKLTGGTFTVSNLGAFGVRQFTPILNPPQVGILGVGAIDYMVKNTAQGLLYYPAGNLSLTFDHRIVDGGPAARFLQRLCKNLENIEELI